ncbi:MAG: transcription factor S [Nitrososphaeria archaeon]|jgi:DNA-directed RNA polymerase subunit M
MPKFCPKDGTLLKLKSEKKGQQVELVYVCPTCGYTEKYRKEKVLEKKVSSEEESLKIIDENADLSALPTVTVTCPKCGNNKAYWWMVQTRSADEPPTQFYRCTKCGYTWRVYT